MIKFEYDKNQEKQILKVQQESKIKQNNPQPFFHLYEKTINEVEIGENDKFIKDQIKLIEEDWKSIEEGFLKALGDFYEKDLESPDLKCYLVRTGVYPYYYEGDNQWFAAPLFSQIPEIRRVIAHELCHYFQPTELPRSIKEAIPIIINDVDTFGLNFNMDRGHQNDKEEQKWRRKIWDLYKEGKKYSDLLKLIEEK